MKKLFFILLSILTLTVSAQQKIALLEPRIGDGSTTVSGMEKRMILGELRNAIVRIPGYDAFTRMDIDQIMQEQNFQRTGMVSETQIKKLGELSGVDYICVSTLTKSNNEFYLEAYLVHIESGRMYNPVSYYGELTNGKFANMFPACQALAKGILGEANHNSSSEEAFDLQPQNSLPSPPKIAVIVTGAAEGISTIIESKLIDNLVSRGNFNALACTSEFRRLGGDDAGLVRIGKKEGAEFICKVDVTELFGAYFIETRLIGVETMAIEKIVSCTSTMLSVNDISKIVKTIAQDLLSEM